MAGGGAPSSVFRKPHISLRHYAVLRPGEFYRVTSARHITAQIKNAKTDLNAF